MQEELIYIHNMTSPRDILSVSNELERIGLKVKEIELGTAAFVNSVNIKAKDLAVALEKIGFRVLQKQDKELTEEVKFLLGNYLAMLREKGAVPNLSDFLEEQMKKPFSSVSKRFRKIEGRTIENYYISLKMEYVKHLLNSSSMSVSEISARLHYSSARSLARVFKEHTGYSIYDFRNKERMAFMMSLNS
ncbi:helix-turn-helix domain-containing protein [Nafulsella turpanensis]|uniref:helix-turn-helix domain-containing protein n=1 Tax=Nafulsella turpanensis TaxID=1265690 RepID=UPI00034AD01D|nr:helix-turn-helix domain-containing protein [Nafulsella turpanensis]